MRGELWFLRGPRIEAFIKYRDWEGESSGRRPALYELNGDGTITCLGGRDGFIADIPGRHPKNRNGVSYIVSGCTGCAFMPYCRRFMKESEGAYRIFEVPVVFQRYKQQARDRLLTPEGIEMRVNRSCQSEGWFGSLKEDMAYRRFRRTSLQDVSTELMLTLLGYNLGIV